MSKHKLIFLILITVFLLTRLAGVDFVYHQDEHRWLLLADGTVNEAPPHPPLALLLMKFTGTILDFENLRVLSVFFSFINLWLLYLVVGRMLDKKTALLASALYTLNIYSLVAGLQVDIDGAILPFFILLGYFGYLNLIQGVRKNLSLFLLVLAVIGGFLTKISFVLFFLVLLFDYVIRLYEKNKSGFVGVLKPVFKIGALIFVLFVLLFYFFSSRFGTVVDYAAHFKSLNFGSRAYLELAFKVAKSFVWLSPLLAVSLAGGLFFKDIWNRQRLWYLYILANLLFYLILFDFSKLTIERYFMFLIVPAVIITSDFLFTIYKKFVAGLSYKNFVPGLIIFIVFSALVFLRPHEVLPLNPKTTYVEHIKEINFDFLIPFSSGSGPIGFYFSAQFILWSWILTVLILSGYILTKHTEYKAYFFASFLVFGLGYNIVFMNELLRGDLYGSPDKVVHQTLNYVLNDPSITKVITYNDIAPYDLKKSGKYASRFYTAPERDYTKKMSTFKGHYMIVDFPAIDKNGRYWPLISRCSLIKKFQDKKVESYIFDCSKI